VSEQNSTTTDEFVRNLTDEQRRIYAYIRSLVWNATDADDVLQSTNAVLWVKREDFTAGTDFGSWAVRVAHYEVLAYRSRKTADRHQFSDDTVLSKMASDVGAVTERISERQVYLEVCLEDLPEEQRDALRARYEPGITVADIARQQGRSVAAISQQLFRTRNQVLDCIEAKMASEGSE
jgi:RNA polymerase sigma-70 factor (ECF subfamily)